MNAVGFDFGGAAIAAVVVNGGIVRKRGGVGSPRSHGWPRWFVVRL